MWLTPKKIWIFRPCRVTTYLKGQKSFSEISSFIFERYFKIVQCCQHWWFSVFGADDIINEIKDPKCSRKKSVGSIQLLQLATLEIFCWMLKIVSTECSIQKLNTSNGYSSAIFSQCCQSQMWLHTVWKFQDFSVIQILHETNFEGSRSCKYANLLDFSLQKVQKFIEIQMHDL